MPKKDKEINTPEAPEGSDAKDIQKWSVWTQGPKDAKETKRKFQQTTPGQVRDYKHFVSNRRFTQYEQVEEVQPKNEDAPTNSVAGGGVDMAPNAKGTKVFMKKFRVDGRTKEYREANRRIKERQEKIVQRQVQAKLDMFGVHANPFAEETENKKYFDTKEGSIEDAIISALTNFENPNKDKETLTLPNKKDVEVEETYKGKEKRKVNLGGNKRKGDVKKMPFAQKAEEKKSGYLEPDMKKRQANNEKARKDMKKMGTPMKNPHLEEVEIDELSDKTMDSYSQKASASQASAEKKQDYKTADKRISGKLRATRRKFSNDTNRILKGLKKESKETENGERDAGSDKYTNYTKEMTPGQGITSDDAKKADVRKKKEQAAQQQQLNVDENMEKYLKTKPMSLESAVLEALVGEKHNPDHYNKQTTTQVGSKQKIKPSYNTKTHKMVTKPGGGVSIVPKSTPGTAAESTQVKHEKGDKHDEVPEKRAGESDKDHKERTAGRVSFKQHRRSLDAVNPDELKGKHKDRDDKDIDNDGDVDGSDKFLHRRRQAIASKQRKEEVKIDELSKKTLGSYVKKASVDKSNATLDLGISQGPKQTRADVTKHAGKAIKRQKGIDKAVDKLSKEEVEEARGAPSPKNIQGPARRYSSPLDSPNAIAAREKLRKVMKGIKKKDPDHPAVQNIKDK